MGSRGDYRLSALEAGKLHPWRPDPKQQIPGDHGGPEGGGQRGPTSQQRIQDPDAHPPALETIYRTLKLYQLFREKPDL